MAKGEQCVILPCHQIAYQLNCFCIKTFSHPFAEKNWDRFFHQAERVKELDYDYANKGQKIISQDALVLLAAMRPRLALLPNLTRLVWVVVDDVHFAFARLFMHSKLKKLQLIILPDVSTTGLRDFIEGLPKLCPELTDLDLSANIRIPVLEPVLSTVLSALPHLEEVNFPAFGITSSVIRALSKHKHLKKVYARPFWGLGFAGDSDDVKTIDVSDLPRDCFPDLQELDLDGGFSVLRNVLSAQCIPRSLTRLYFSAFEGEPLHSLKSLLDFIANEFIELTFLGVAYLIKPPEPLGLHDAGNEGQVAETIPRISFDVLRPALRLRKLRSFHVMHNRPLLLTEFDIEEMGRAWNDTALRCLRLVPDPVFAPGVNLESDLTLGTLEIFARCLPKLERLELYIDATRDIPTGSPKHIFEELTTLDVGISPVAQNEHGAIARWLAKLMPKKSMTLLYGADWSLNWAEINFSTDLEYLLPRRNYWQRIGEIHNQLCIAAEDLRNTAQKKQRVDEARIKELEEELARLKSICPSGISHYVFVLFFSNVLS